MNRILLRIVMLLGCLLSLSRMDAEGVYTVHFLEPPYSELFTDGKEWTLYHIAEEVDRQRDVHWKINVKVDGEKEIEGIECKRLVISTEKIGNSDCYDCLNWLDKGFIEECIAPRFKGTSLGIPSEVYVYEKDRKIYFYRNPGWKFNSTDPMAEIEPCEPRFEVFMDLNYTTGEKVPEHGIISKDECISIHNKFHRKISFVPEDPIHWSQNLVWIEGIGASNGLSMYESYHHYFGFLPLHMVQPFYILANCKENGVTLFDQTELLQSLGLDITTAVDTITDEPRSQPDQCFDLHGRPLQTPPSKGFFIRNGKIQFNP